MLSTQLGNVKSEMPLKHPSRSLHRQHPAQKAYLTGAGCSSGGAGRAGGGEEERLSPCTTTLTRASPTQPLLALRLSPQTLQPGQPLFLHQDPRKHQALKSSSSSSLQTVGQRAHPSSPPNRNGNDPAETSPVTMATAGQQPGASQVLETEGGGGWARPATKWGHSTLYTWLPDAEIRGVPI